MKDKMLEEAKRLSAVEELAREFHAIYQAEAKRQGDVRHHDDYDALSENIKEFDRVLARRVLEREAELVERLEQLRTLAHAARNAAAAPDYDEEAILDALWTVAALAAQQREDEEPFEYKVGDKIYSWGVIRNGERIKFPWL